MSGPSPFGALLRRHRAAAGLSQEALAGAADVGVNTIADLEAGRHRAAHPATAAALAHGLGLPPAQARAFAATAAQARVRGPRVGGGGRPPAPPTALVGREDDLAAAVATLQGGARLLTLVGPGGVGKTRLAVAVAAALARDGDVPAGVWVADLAPVADAALVPSAVAAALGLRPGGAPPTADAVATHLAGRRALLLLDTVERVAPAAGALAAALLATCPDLRVLATGRVALRVRGERAQPVDPLAVPDPDPLPDPAALARSPAVRLLVARARDALPGFRLTTDNAVAVAAICRRLDGLPLALELAAPHLATCSPAALLARLARPLDLLVDGPRDLPARQRALRDAIAWSDDLLGPVARSLFRHLATFPDGATLDDLRMLAAAGGRAYAAADPGDALATLMAHHLVRRLDDGTGGDPRYGLLATSRDYAAERPVLPHAHQNPKGAEYAPVRRDPDKCGG
jgi:predicted ATPase/transcriptional regulator with XRE-family HTH domain